MSQVANFTIYQRRLANPKREYGKKRPELPPLVGQSPAFVALLEQASRVAPLDRPTLVIGERGTGKELIAERLHYLSPRWDGAFVKVNCAALSGELLDSELFGHEQGAFTGAFTSGWGASNGPTAARFSSTRSPRLAAAGESCCA